MKRLLTLLIATVALASCASAESSVTIAKDATRGERVAALYKWLDGNHPTVDREEVLEVVDQICGQLPSDSGTPGDFVEIAGFMELGETTLDENERQALRETIAKQGMRFLCPDWVFMADTGQQERDERKAKEAVATTSPPITLPPAPTTRVTYQQWLTTHAVQDTQENFGLWASYYGYPFEEIFNNAEALCDHALRWGWEPDTTMLGPIDADLLMLTVEYAKRYTGCYGHTKG